MHLGVSCLPGTPSCAAALLRAEHKPRRLAHRCSPTAIITGQDPAVRQWPTVSRTCPSTSGLLCMRSIRRRTARSCMGGALACQVQRLHMPMAACRGAVAAAGAATGTIHSIRSNISLQPLKGQPGQVLRNERWTLCWKRLRQSSVSKSKRRR